jgi:micrococcal nuclease
MRRRTLRLWSALIAAIVALALAYLRQEAVAPEAELPPLDSGQPRLCVRVVDGDTLVLDGGERVRLIGVNAPESVDPRRPVEPFGEESAAFTRRMAEGRRVRLEFDLERRDQYGRTLAYVFLEDGTFLNAEIIRQGYARAYTGFPFRYRDEFVALEREARRERRGLWER